MAEVASAFVSLLPSARGFGSKTEKQLAPELDKSGKKIGARFGTAIKGGAVLAAAGGVAAIGFLKGAFAEARDAQKVGALTVSTIKATGGAANVSAKQVGDLAGALSAKTGIDDEVIQSGQNMLLTFKNIRNEAGKGNDIFNQTSATLIDMAAAIGTEPKQAAIQLGKALNDPIRGVTALSRVGVTFTDQQRAQIKTLVESGKTMDAQKIILKELRSEFGGAAEAQATAGDKAQVAWGNLQETVGTLLLPLWDKVLGAGTRVMVFLTNNLGPAIGKVGDFITPVKDAIGDLFSSMDSGGATGGFLSAVKSIASTIKANFLPVLQAAANTFRTVVLPAILAVASYLVANLVPIFKQVWGVVANQVVPVVARLAKFFYGTLYPAVLRIVVAVGKSLRPVLDALFDVVRKSVIPAIRDIAKRFREWQPTIEKVIKVTITIVGWVLKLAAAILGRVLPPLIRFAGFMIRTVVKVIATVIGWVIKIIGKVIDFGGAIGRAAGHVADFVRGLRDKFGDAIGFVKSLPGRIVKALGNLGGLLRDAGSDLISGLWEGIQSMGDWLKDKIIGFVADKIPGPVKKVLGISSPSKLMRDEVGRWIPAGLALGIEDGTREVTDAARRMAASVVVAPPRLGVDTTAGAGGASAARPIEVHGIKDPMAVAREVVRLEAWAGV